MDDYIILAKVNNSGVVRDSGCNNLEKLLASRHSLNQTGCCMPKPYCQGASYSFIDSNYSVSESMAKSQKFRSVLDEWDNKLNEINLIKNRLDCGNNCFQPLGQEQCIQTLRRKQDERCDNVIKKLLIGADNNALKTELENKSKYEVLLKELEDRLDKEHQELVEKAALCDQMVKEKEQEEASKLYYMKRKERDEKEEKAAAFEILNKAEEERLIIEKYKLEQSEKEKEFKDTYLNENYIVDKPIACVDIMPQQVHHNCRAILRDNKCRFLMSSSTIPAYNKF